MPPLASEPDECCHPLGSLPPHPPLASYSLAGFSRESYLRNLFDEAAPDYERIERLMTLGRGSRYRNHALRRAGLTRGLEVLDVAVGTGLLAREALTLVGPQGRVVGVDPSPGMLKEVREPRLQLLHGQAEALPVPDASCDFLSMGYALRHLRDLHAAFAEFYRVLRPGGRLLLLEITQPKSRWGRLLLRSYIRVAVPWMARFIGCRRTSTELWRYYHETIESCLPPPIILEALHAAGFVEVERHVEIRLFSEYRACRPQTQ
ncbi:MAG: class I SAM-dependent methyltransferase [Candidatus Methylacidiphilaceae bacterium]